jgi:hypothetical protein
MYEDRFAWSQPAALVKSQISQVERIEEGRRLDVAQFCWCFERHGRRAHHHFRVGTDGSSSAGRDPLADRGFGARPRLDDLTDALHTEGIGEWGVNSEVATATAVDLVVVEDAGRRPHQDLAGPGGWLGHVPEFEGLGRSPVSRYLPGAHLSTLWSLPEAQEQAQGSAQGIK